MKRILFTLIASIILIPSTVFGAIAFDTATASGQTTGSTLTFSHTVTGSNPILWVGVVSYGTNAVTGVTYNGSSMTAALGGGLTNVGGAYIYLYYLANPSTGANNVVVSQSAANTIQAVAASYTGASATGIPDSSATAINQSGSNATVNTTTIADNSWLVGVVFTNRNNSNGSDTTIRGALTSQFSFADSNGAKTPAGSHALNVTMSSASTFTAGTASFAPYTAPPPVPISTGSDIIFFD